MRQIRNRIRAELLLETRIQRVRLLQVPNIGAIDCTQKARLWMNCYVSRGTPASIQSIDSLYVKKLR